MLRVGDMDAKVNNFRRHLRVAELWEVHVSYQRPLLPPIFDPELLATLDDGFLLAGVELQAVGNAGFRTVSEHRQLWLCIPA